MAWTGVEEKSLYTACVALRPTWRESDEKGHDVFSCNPPGVMRVGQWPHATPLYERRIGTRQVA